MMFRVLACSLFLSVCWCSGLQARDGVVCSIRLSTAFDATLSRPFTTALKGRVLKISVKDRRFEICLAEDDRQCTIAVIPPMTVRSYPAFTRYEVQWTEDILDGIEKNIIVIDKPPEDDNPPDPIMRFYTTSFKSNGNELHLSGTMIAEGRCRFP